MQYSLRLNEVFYMCEKSVYKLSGLGVVAPTIVQDSTQTNLKISVMPSQTTLVQVTPTLNYTNSILVRNYGTQIRLKSALSP
jgi:hypothetical protein